VPDSPIVCAPFACPKEIQIRTPRGREGGCCGFEFYEEDLELNPFDVTLPKISLSFSRLVVWSGVIKRLVPRTIVVFSRSTAASLDPIIKSSLRIIFSLFVQVVVSTEKRAQHSRIPKRRGFAERILVGPLSLSRIRMRVLLLLAETPLQPAFLLLGLWARGRWEVAPGRCCG